MDNEQAVDGQEVSEAQQPEQKMLSQDEVNRIVGREKARERERAQREAEQRYQQELESVRNQAPASVGGMSVDEDAIVAKAMERFQSELQQRQQEAVQEQQRQEIERIANDFHTKMSGGKDIHPDFEEVTGGYSAQHYPLTTYLATMAENTPSIVYELSKNPQKRAMIEWTAERDLEGAQKLISELSNSIKSNEEAKREAEQQSTNIPLSRIAPSPVGSDNGNLGLRDLKRQPWLRG